MRPTARQALWFTGVRQVALREETLPAIGPGQLGVTTAYSAISAGTELLLYRGQMPQGMAADGAIAALSATVAYPMKYGYSCVGVVTDVGAGVDAAWLGRTVFAFQPHQSFFVAGVEDVIWLEGCVSAETATLLPNMETAVSFVMDGTPVIGERVLIIGQGIVGLLTARILAQMPLGTLTTCDVVPQRRQLSASLSPNISALSPEQVASSSYDLVYELSGNPAALNRAIEAVGFGGRIVVGSWYGTKQAALNLGGDFHRKHVQLLSSQVSTLGPRWHARWTKQRRMAVALAQLAQHDLSALISQRVPFARADSAYALLDGGREQVMQIIFEYGSS